MPRALPCSWSMSCECEAHLASGLGSRLSALLPALQWPQALNKHLEEVDPELFTIIEKEKNRQWKVHSCDMMLVLPYARQ
jgi:hypothetical protein